MSLPRLEARPAGGAEGLTEDAPASRRLERLGGIVWEQNRRRQPLDERVVEQSRGTIVRGHVGDQLRQSPALSGAEEVVSPTMPSQGHVHVTPICNCML